VHHRTYERVGRELMSDLDVVCKRHHELYHQMKDLDRLMTKKAGAGWRKKYSVSQAIRLVSVDTRR